MKLTNLFALIVSIGLFTAPTSASIQVYTDRDAFLAAIQPGYYLETFDDLVLGVLNSPTTFSGSDFNFTASATNVLWAGTSGGDTFLTDGLGYPITIGSLSGPTPVTALGGYFFENDGTGSIFPDAPMTITATAGTLSSSWSGPTNSTSFIGFISGGPAFTQLSFTKHSDYSSYPSTNDFIVGTAAAGNGAVPEATSLAIWCLLGVALSVVAPRRRGRAEV